MNIIFFGSSHFALPSLKSLLDKGHTISCVVTQPDKRKGRHLNLSGTAIKEFAINNGLVVYGPEKINVLESANFLKKFQADLFVVIAYGQILSREILDIPKIMALNVHGSLLPLYRGAAPINWAVINAEKETGVTLIKMTEKMDAGPIIAQKKINIQNDDTFVTLESSLSALAGQLLIESLGSISNNAYQLTQQNENKVTYAPKLNKKDGLINWDKNAAEINNQIRGCLGWPDAFTYYKGKMLKILMARTGDSQDKKTTNSPGEIMETTKEGIVVATKIGVLVIQELKPEGKRKMTAKEFVLGHKVSAGELFGENK